MPTNITKTRDSNLELFRIVLMLAIIAHHYVVNSGLMACIDAEPTSVRSLGLLLFGAWGKTGINCFLLITGFFMCQSNISLKKFLKLLLEICFYKIIFGCIFIVAGYTPITLKEIAKIILPLLSVNHNFGGCFLLFFLGIPFLNILIKALSHRNFTYLLVLLLGIYTILPSGGIPVVFNYVTWFGIVYLVAAYIRIYLSQYIENEKVAINCWGGVTLALLAVSCLSVIALTFVFKSRYLFFLADSNKILAVLTSIALFLFFRNLKLGYSKFINTVAQSTFGVLLIHANSDAMRQWLWKDTLQNVRFFDSPYLWLHAVLSVLGIYIICVIIDQLRIRLIEKPFFNYFGEKIDNIEDKIFRR